MLEHRGLHPSSLQKEIPGESDIAGIYGTCIEVRSIWNTNRSLQESASITSCVASLCCTTYPQRKLNVIGGYNQKANKDYAGGTGRMHVKTKYKVSAVLITIQKL